MTYPATGGSSVQLATAAGGGLWVNDDGCPRLRMPLTGATYDVVCAVLDALPDNVEAEAGAFVTGSTAAPGTGGNFMKLGLYRSGTTNNLTFAWAVGGSTGFVNSGVSVTLPVALMLQRRGSSWTAWYKSSAATDAPHAGPWTQYSTAQTANFASLAAGLYIASTGAHTNRFDYAQLVAADGPPYAISQYGGRF